MARLGVEEELFKLGARPGCAVTIGDMTFDWEPSTPTGIAGVLGNRGTDLRLDRNDRPGAADRKAAKLARREPGEYDEDYQDDVSVAAAGEADDG